MNLRALISGSDVRGKALGEGAVLNDALAVRLGEAFAAFLYRKNGSRPKVYIGRDSRLTGEALSAASWVRGASGPAALRALRTATPAFSPKRSLPLRMSDGG